jgi:hypothetical protein
VSRAQLLELGLSRQAIEHRLARGRLHRVWRGVYAVGRPELTRYGRWMAAVLSCGPWAVLSHTAAAALWEISAPMRGPIHVSVPPQVDRRRPRITVHRRTMQAADSTRRHGIPITSPVVTLIDIATLVSPRRLEAAVNEADIRGLADPETLLSAAHARRTQPGSAALRCLLDRQTFVLTDSELERLFLPLAHRAGLPRPETGRYVNGFKVDFLWPDLGLVVETDGLRYHRTPTQQAKDRKRDQVHAVAVLATLRFTHFQVHYEPDDVVGTLAALAARLSAARPRRWPPGGG